MPTNFYNIQGLASRRKSLRNNMPAPEQRIWYFIKSKQLGYKFRRQYSFGNYIVDFYCPELRLVVEIDGDSHGTEESVLYDKKRSEYLESAGVLIKRYNNGDIMKNIEGVIGDLKNFIFAINTPSCAKSASASGGNSPL